MKTLPLVLLLFLVACGGPNVAATATREGELRQIATLTAPTATIMRPPTVAPPTLGPVQMTAQAVIRQQQATQMATSDAACAEVAKVYASNGQPFDPNAARYNPQQMITEVEVMLRIINNHDSYSEFQKRYYSGYIATCGGR